MGKLFHSGDIIYSNGKPFVYVLCSDERSKRCDNCFSKLSEKFLQCLNCRYVRFCNEKCQRESAELHQPECLLIGLRPLKLLTRLILRCLIKTTTTSVDSDWIYGHERSWNCLMDHHDDIIRDVDAMLTFGAIIEELELLFRKNLSTSDVEQILSIYGKILINSFAITEPDTGRVIGRALYLGASIFDHSCNPDLYFQFDGLRIYFLVANRDIYLKEEKDDEINCEDINKLHISYIDELIPVQERRNYLQSNYYFDCQCFRCQEDHREMMSIRMSYKINSNISQLFEMIEDYFQSDPILNLIEMVKNHFFGDDILPNLDQKISSIERLIEHDYLWSSNLKQWNLLKQQESYQMILNECCQLLNTVAYDNANHLELGPKIRFKDFLSSHNGDLLELEQLIYIYGKYYCNHNHPRLLRRLWFWITCLVILFDHQKSKNDRSFKIQINNLLRSMLLQIKMIRTFLRLDF